MKSSTYYILLSFSLAMLVCCIAGKKDRSQPHGHRGKLQTHTPGPFDVMLAASEEDKLKAGNALLKHYVPANPAEASGSVCVQDVKAPVSAVWHQILDFASYWKKVPMVKECNVYAMQNHADGRVSLKTKHVMGVLPGYSVRSVDERSNTFV
jgi:hypothetical protein